MRILHLSADYPDPVAPAKTRAIRNLLELVPQHQHHVYALNRIAWHRTLAAQTFPDQIAQANRAVEYPAPPKGIRHRSALQRLAHWIWQDCLRTGIRPDAVHAHKLTVEGLVGHLLAELFDVPLIVSVQGNTDLKIAQAKPDLRADFQKIWHSAAVALPFAPWAGNGLDAVFGHRTRPTQYLPCPTTADQMIAPMAAPTVLRTAFHLKDHRNKNAERLIKAVGQVVENVPQVRLDIIGGTDATVEARLQRIADRHAPGRVRFCGPLPNHAMQTTLNSSAAFALVSHRESFGMVFAEALLAGTPCLIPKNQGIDGYLPDGDVTLSADPNDTRSIAAGLTRLLTQQTKFKARLHDRQQTGALDFLRREAIAKTYDDALARACPKGAVHSEPAPPRPSDALTPA